MKYFYIIRFLEKPIVKIGISQNLESRIRQHYFTYRELDLDLKNIDVIYGDSAKVRLLESYIKCKFDHLELNMLGYTELFSSDHEIQIIDAIDRLSEDLEMDCLKRYIPKFESKIASTIMSNYESETSEKVELFVSLFNRLKGFVQSIKQDEQSNITIEFDVEGLEVELIRTLYNYRLNIEYTFQTGWGSSNLIITNELVHNHKYAFTDRELYDSDFYFGVVSDEDTEKAIEFAHKVVLELNLNQLQAHYPQTWSQLPSELKFSTFINH